MTWSPAHIAVEQGDLPRLRDLLNSGHDVEDDGGRMVVLRTQPVATLACR
jgi:hypothetical protein